EVPAHTLIVVGLVGMVAGVLAATLTVTTTNFSGESGILRNNTGNVQVTDNVLGVVANGASASTSADFAISSIVNTAMTTGHWFYKLAFTDTVDISKTHTVTVPIRDGTGIEPAHDVMDKLKITSAS